MNNIFTVKVNKGGIGKTFFKVQIGHGLALQGYKVLLITSDSQNNILHYTKNKKEYWYLLMEDINRLCKIYDIKYKTFFFNDNKSS